MPIEKKIEEKAISYENARRLAEIVHKGTKFTEAEWIRLRVALGRQDRVVLQEAIDQGIGAQLVFHRPQVKRQKSMLGSKDPLYIFNPEFVDHLKSFHNKEVQRSTYRPLFEQK